MLTQFAGEAVDDGYWDPVSLHLQTTAKRHATADYASDHLGLISLIDWSVRARKRRRHASTWVARRDFNRVTAAAIGPHTHVSKIRRITKGYEA
jgi:hypothetical protein